MLKKIILAVTLSLSVSGWAAPEGNQTKPSADSDQQTQTSQADSSAAKENSQSAPRTKADKKSPMVEYCKKHTC